MKKSKKMQLVDNLIKEALKTGFLKCDANGEFKNVKFVDNFAVLKLMKLYHSIGFPTDELVSEESYKKIQMCSNKAIAEGAQIAKMIASKHVYGEDGWVSDYVEVQSRVPGKPIMQLKKYFDYNYNLPFDIDDDINKDLKTLSEIPQEHYTKLFKTLNIMYDNSLIADFQNMGNFLYDEKTGFWVVDLKSLIAGPFRKSNSGLGPDAAWSFYKCITRTLFEACPRQHLKDQPAKGYLGGVVDKLIVAEEEINKRKITERDITSY